MELHAELALAAGILNHEVALVVQPEGPGHGVSHTVPPCKATLPLVVGPTDVVLRDGIGQRRDTAASVAAHAPSSLEASLVAALPPGGPFPAVQFPASPSAAW